jgi:RluA family pseudouridine synthase
LREWLLSLDVEAEPLEAPTPDFPILFEDSSCLVVAKPAGLLTQAPLGIDSLEFRIKRYLKARDAKSGLVYLGVPHRIDRPVSGVILFAKNVRSARRISEQFEGRLVEKKYWALVAGEIEPATGTWTDHLKKIAGEPRTIVVEQGDPEGKIAILHYRSVKTIGLDSTSSMGANAPYKATLLEIELETGRTHQIRVQCASRGHALLGDELYGSKIPFGPPSDDERARLIALHARSLKFRHPSTREYLEFTATLPPYWPIECAT